MIRSIAAAVVTTAIVFTSAPAMAQQPAAPSKAVAAAWAKEQKSSPTIKALIVTYGAMAGLDAYSTKMARDRGAVEANPMMAGSMGRALAMKAAMGATTMFAVHAMAKKNRKAAVATMIALNVASAIVVANNVHNAQRLR